MTLQKPDPDISREAGPDEAERRVLCLPGGLCTAAFFDDLFAESAIRAGDARLMATTLPGFGGVPIPAGFDATVEAHARRAAGLAERLGCDGIVGHSYGANVAIEMVLGGHFSGNLILLSPTFSREDEARALGVINRINHVPVLRSVVDAIFYRSLPKMLEGSVPPERVDELTAEMAAARRDDVRRTIRRYFEYLDRVGTLAGRLCRSGVQAEVVFGDADDTGITAAERSALESCPTTRLRIVPECGHMTLNQRPAWVAEMIATALARDL